jgi:hypothetical protein
MSFLGFWTGMNNNYVFWDIDPTDWDSVYKTFRPKFAALDTMEINSYEQSQEQLQRAKEYFIDMTKDLIDGHFGIMLAGYEGMPIMPLMARFFQQHGANFYDRATWESSGIFQTEFFEGNANLAGGSLLPIVKEYFEDKKGLYVSIPNDPLFGFSGGFSAITGKIPLADNSDDSILYFYFSYFMLFSFLHSQTPALETYQKEMWDIWEYFLDNLYDPNVKGVIVDVRGNPGGFVVDLSLLWGQMFSRERHKVAYNRLKMGDGRLDFSPLIPFYIYSDPQNTKDLDIPLVLLINNFSASCSELSALIVRSLPGGFLVGGTTAGAFGQLTGDGRNVLYNAGEFSTAKIELTYTPFSQLLDLNMLSFEGRGIESDYYVPFDYESFSQGIDTRLEKAIEVIQARQ